MPNVYMFDDTNVDLIPADATEIAVYTDGIYENAEKVKAKFPHAKIVTIAVRASDDAEAIDDEPGDVGNAEIAAWVHRQLARGVVKPIVYTSVSNIDAAMAELMAAGITRDKVTLWSAHYGQGDHICGIATCGLCRATVDWTQFTDHARGVSLDMTDMGAAKPVAPAKPVVTIPESALQHVQADITAIAEDLAKVQAVEADLKDAENMENEIAAYVKQHG